MAFRIATNVQALTAQRFLTKNYNDQNRSLERLASGARINRAADDAAGLAISERLRANIRSMNQATRNANDGISLIQTAEGALSEMSNILIRMRELSIQSASDTIGNSERLFVDKEVQHLKEEVERIANSTDFNGYKLLNGTSPTLEFQIGINNNPVLDRIGFNTQAIIATQDSLGILGVSTSTRELSQLNLDQLDAAITKVNGYRADLGALQNRLGSTINNLTIYRENLETANSRIRDTDIATESSELMKSNILTQANVAVLSQANQNAAMALKLLN